MTRCQHCEHEFHNVTLRRDCPRCGQNLKAPAEERRKEEDSGPDVAGFAVGLMTGLPIGPQGVTMASVAGAMMHSSGHAHASEPAPTAPETPSFTPGGGDSGGGGASSSYDSGSSSSDSSSSSSSDSGGSSGGSSD